MSAQKQKGTAAETAVVTYLTNYFDSVKRHALAGKNDVGDVDAFDWTAIEVKNHQRMELATWLDEALVEGKRKGSWLNVVWHKRARKGSPADWYVTMNGDTFVAVLRLVKEYYTIMDAYEKEVGS